GFGDSAHYGDHLSDGRLVSHEGLSPTPFMSSSIMALYGSVGPFSLKTVTTGCARDGRVVYLPQFLNLPVVHCLQESAFPPSGSHTVSSVFHHKRLSPSRRATGIFQWHTTSLLRKARKEERVSESDGREGGV
ncbi:hypothetical protein DNTS_018033, partial [Danionella cerebrum]